MTELDAHQLRLATKNVKAVLHRLVAERGPIDIDSIYEAIERDPTCTAWRRHFWESCPHTGPKGAVQAEWKHKIRTFLQSREKGKKIYAFDKSKGWRVLK